MTHSTPLTRRAILAGGAAGVVACASASLCSQGFADESDKTTEKDIAVNNPQNVQFGFLVRPANCQGCGDCVVACREGNELPQSVADRRWVTSVPKNRGTLHASTSCMHCAEPQCAAVCPAGAISKGVGGIVSVDKARCIGCRYCRQACPYDVPTYSEAGMDKCDYCLSSGIPLGDDPWCVRACIFGALYHGTMEQLVHDAPDAYLIAAAGGPSCLIAQRQ